MSSQCFSHCSKDSRLTILHLLNAISDLTSWVRKGTHWVRLLSHIPPSVSPSFLSWRLSNGWQGRLSLTGRWWSKLHWQHRRYIWAASAATPARPGILWESRRPSRCRFFDYFIVILLFCCCLCCFCDIFIVIQSYSVFIVIQQYIWAASAAATPARPELLWESRRPSQCRLSYFSGVLPIRGDMTHLEPTLFRIFLRRDSNRHNWDAVSSY